MSEDALKRCPMWRRPVEHKLLVLSVDLIDFDSAHNRAHRVYCRCSLIGPLAPSKDAAIEEWNRWLGDE